MTDAKRPAGKPAGLTPSATVGPYFKYGLTPNGAYPWNDAFSNDIASADVAGDRITITGRVLDGDGKPINDSMLEIWQADASGRFAHPLQGGAPANAAFKGFARAETDADGRFSFKTVKPGAVAWPKGGQQAPHILMAVFARGMLKQQYTRIYFADEAAANAADPVLALVPAERRRTIVAPRDGATYRFDVNLQGPDETVFFDV
jgi:protocatechuate 3,4-dioxygenase alpha subunit